MRADVPLLRWERALERLLACGSLWVRSGETLREIRALQVLERVGSPEAIRLLKASEWAPPGWGVFDAALGAVEFLGAITRVELKLNDGAVLRVASLDVMPDELPRGRVVAAYDPRRITVFPR